MKRITEYSFFTNLKILSILSFLVTLVILFLMLHGATPSEKYSFIIIILVTVLLYFYIFVCVLVVLLLLDYGIRTILEALSIKGKYGVVVKSVIIIAIITLIIKLFGIWK